MKKILISVCLLATMPAFAQTTIAGKVQDFGKKVIISYYQDFNFNSDTIELNKNSQFQRQYSFTSPTYIRLATIEPQTFSAFFLVMPNETIEIDKSRIGIKLNGSLQAYNIFVEQLNQDMKNKFSGVVTDSDLLLYKFEKLNEFFANFSGPNSAMIKSLSTVDAIIDRALYPLLIKWNSDNSKMQMIAQIFKNPNATPANDGPTKYLNKINFDDENLQYLGIPSLSMFNNLIRILRMHEVKNDTLLKEQDEYVIESRIIKTLFKETPFRARLLGYNLYSRVDEYTKYPMALSGVEDYINDYKKDKFTSGLIPSIESIYLKQKSTLGSLAKGATAPSFKLPNSQGKLVSLSDFKGKVVYLDLWASWCGPCLEEMPHLKKMRERFAGKDVAFVAISIDTDTGKWLKKIKDMKLEGIQLIDKVGSQNSKIATDYKVHGVPHYVLIDKKGKIASAFAPIPSSTTEIDKEINKLLNN